MAFTEVELHGMMTSTFGDEKLNKMRELGPEMSIRPSGDDEYSAYIKNIGGATE